MVAQEFLVLSVGVQIPAGLPLLKSFLTFLFFLFKPRIYSPGGGGKLKGSKVGGGGGGGGMLSKLLSAGEDLGGVLNTSPSGTSELLSCNESPSSAKGSNGVSFASGAGSIGELLNGSTLPGGGGGGGAGISSGTGNGEDGDSSSSNGLNEGCGGDTG